MTNATAESDLKITGAQVGEAALMETETELAACRAAFEGVPAGAWCWLIHHNILAERLLEPIEARIACILADKPEWQHPRRFREMRPVKAVDDPVFVAAVAAWNRAGADWDRALDRTWADWERAVDRARADFANAVGPLHRREQPGSAWDGETIFPESRKEEVQPWGLELREGRR